MQGYNAYQQRLIDSWGCHCPTYVYDKNRGKTSLFSRLFSFILETTNPVIDYSLTEAEKRAFSIMYSGLPQVLFKSIVELDSLLELRSRLCADDSDALGESVRSTFKRQKRADTKGRMFTERSERMLDKIETPLPNALWNRLLSIDDSFMDDEQMRLDFFIRIMRHIWASPSKQCVLDAFLDQFCLDQSKSIVRERMLPYFVYHQTVIHSITMSASPQYRLAFLRIPQGAKYRFIVTDNPAIDLGDEQFHLGVADNGCFLWVLSPMLAVMLGGKKRAKTRFVTEDEVTIFNRQLFKKATRYIMLDKDNDILSACC